MSTKKCSCCGKELPLDNFYQGESYGSKGISSRCKPCSIAIAKKHQQKQSRVNKINSSPDIILLQIFSRIEGFLLGKGVPSKEIGDLIQDGVELILRGECNGK